MHLDDTLDGMLMIEMSVEDTQEVTLMENSTFDLQLGLIGEE